MLNIKRKINKSIPAVIQKLGYFINPLILNFTNENNRLLIFYFHGLYTSSSEKEKKHVDPQNNITVREFEEFIDYFQHHKYQFIKPEDLSGDLSKDQPYAMITFDDGYFNNTLAIEILKKHEIPATFFVTTKNIIENKSFWWDIIYKYRTKQGINLETIRKEQASLKNYKYSYIEDYITQNFGFESFKSWSDIDRPLNEYELKNLARNPFVSIGNHTHNHAILTNYNKEEIKEEFALSNKILFDITGIIPISTAFPNGNFNNLVLEVAEEVGFRFAFTTQSGVNYLPIKNNTLNLLDRFMTKPVPVKQYITFNRLNYDPKSLYNQLKRKINIF